MGTYHESFWEPQTFGGSRKQRAAGKFHYYLPAPLSTISFALENDVVADAYNAEKALVTLEKTTNHLHSTDGIARLLIRAEAVSSSFIEGLTIGTRRLLRSEFDTEGRLWKADSTADAVIGNISAMQTAIHNISAGQTITLNNILELHSTLAAGTPLERYAGEVRTSQNWVGGNSYNPLEAAYVPPAPEFVIPLLEDLAAFINRNDVSPLVKAALAHAQFESIHPFADGNGRTGRALIYVVLKREGIIDKVIPPISLIMATHSASYVEALTAYRFEGEDPQAQTEAFSEFVSFFCGCVSDACSEAEKFEKKIQELIEKWKTALGGVRSKSALELILDAIISQPIFDSTSIRAAIGRSKPATTAAIEKLLDAGIVRQVSAKQRARIFEAPDVIKEFNIFERKLASPAWDTNDAPPARAVPAKI